ncbi:MAG: type II secretion system protein [Syntrophobacteraceae bacterium]
MTSNSRHRHRAGGGGFTLIEMIVVLLILSVTIALIAPRVGSSWKRIEDNDFLQEFTETIKRARLFAINSGRPVAFRLNGAERLYDLAYPPRKPIPQNVQVFSERLERDPESGDFFITFYPDGSLVGNDFEVVFDNARTFRISIHPLFGTVNVARLESR